METSSPGITGLGKEGELQLSEYQNLQKTLRCRNEDLISDDDNSYGVTAGTQEAEQELQDVTLPNLSLTL